MNGKDDILLKIDGQTHLLRPDDPESLRKIPWSQRKRLIDVLEQIKKAEYVASNVSATEKHRPVKELTNRISNVSKDTAATTPQNTQQSEEHHHPPQDSDALMQRFLTEQKKHKSSLPTKASIYKWFLIIFAVIFLLILVL
ncbi:MAG: hypothetical protein OQK49_07835 [Proteobacteria bacterium]|nr:hypothetical protein [Pseudomonadota bacterium]